MKPKITGSKKTSILLVEADIVFAKARTTFLESRGWRVLHVRTGNRAVEHALGRDAPDLVLMNIEPGKGMDGPEAARRILEKCAIPIIFVTRVSDERYLARVRDIARYGFLSMTADDFTWQTTVELALELFRAHQRTAEGEERYRRITDCVTDYRYTVYLEKGKAVRTVNNEACVSVTGYTPEEMEQDGLLWLRMIHPDDFEFLKSTMIGFYKGKTVLEYEHRIIAKDQSVRWVHTTLIPRFDGHGNLTEYDGVVKDITERKKSETLLINRASELAVMQEAIINSMAVLAEFRDPETGAHIERTKLYLKLMLEKLGDAAPYSESERELIWHCAPLHDIGKVAIPDSILLKDGALSETEFELMKKHPDFGFEVIRKAGRLLGENSFLRFAGEITRYHHEWWDGTGYPYGLSGEQIPLTARIMALADVYDALVTARPYKAPIPHGKAVRMILEGSGSHFDPDLVELFHKNHRLFQKIAQEHRD